MATNKQQSPNLRILVESCKKTYLASSVNVYQLVGFNYASSVGSTNSNISTHTLFFEHVFFIKL